MKETESKREKENICKAKQIVIDVNITPSLKVKKPYKIKKMKTNSTHYRS